MLINDTSYIQVLENIKAQIKAAQYRAVLGVNREQILLFWAIGKTITENTKYGRKFIPNLARDIQLAFPKLKGYSVRNLNYMRKFNSFVVDFEKVQTVSALLSWSHNQHLLDKTKQLDEYLWYASQAIDNQWSLTSLEYHTETKAYERQKLAGKVSNYAEQLPAPQSTLALENLKDPYVFDFIERREGMIEREIENELTANITKTLLELGTGFSFVGNQYHLCVGNEDYYIDLLFYNTRLRCYVVVELKVGKFKPEYAGKLNFYLSAVDDTLKHKQDNPTIGILLCKSREKLTAEYALRDINKPIGVSEYKLSDFVPEELADTLPSAEDIENRIQKKYQLEEKNQRFYHDYARNH
jgi:predicted nuclease of restriction endonuclease-like (RecB) superfamily